MTTSLSTRVAQFKQDRILDAAVTVFARQGFHAASMREIAAAAGIAPGSIYNHFENKAALLLGIFERISATAAVAAPPPATNAPLRELLVAVIRRPLAAMTGDTIELFRVILSEVLVNPPLAVQFRHRVLAPMLSACGDALGHHLPAEARPPWLQAMSALVLGLILLRLIGEGEPPPQDEDVAGQLADALLAGLRNAER